MRVPPEHSDPIDTSHVLSGSSSPARVPDDRKTHKPSTIKRCPRLGFGVTLTVGVEVPLVARGSGVVTCGVVPTLLGQSWDGGMLAPVPLEPGRQPAPAEPPSADAGPRQRPARRPQQTTATPITSPSRARPQHGEPGDDRRSDQDPRGHPIDSESMPAAVGTGPRPPTSYSTLDGRPPRGRSPACPDTYWLASDPRTATVHRRTSTSRPFHARPARELWTQSDETAT